MQEANSEDPLGMGWIFFNHFLSLVPGTVSLAKNLLTDMMRALSVPKKGNAKEEVGCSPFSKGLHSGLWFSIRAQKNLSRVASTHVRFFEFSYYVTIKIHNAKFSLKLHLKIDRRRP